MPAQAGIQGGRGWIPAFAGMTKTLCEVVARILPADVFSKEHCAHLLPPPLAGEDEGGGLAAKNASMQMRFVNCGRVFNPPS